MGFFLVLKAEVVRSLIIMRRYWFATLTGLIISYGFLMLLIVAFVANTDAISKMSGTIIEKVAGFLIGMFAMSIVGMFSQGLQGMARTGELEQVCMSPHGLVTNFLARSFVSSIMSILSSSILLVLIAKSLKEGQLLYFDPVPTVTLLGLTYVNLIGFGFMVGGLVLVFKQTGQIAMLIRLALMGLAIFISRGALESWPALAQALFHCVPITDAAICLKYVLIDNQHVAQQAAVLQDGQVVETAFQSVFQTSSFYWLIGNCIVWTVVGISVFKYLEDWSRDKGTLGAY